MIHVLKFIKFLVNFLQKLRKGKNVELKIFLFGKRCLIVKKMTF